MGAESMAIGSAIGALVGIATWIVHKIKCLYKRTSEGDCAPTCSFRDAPLEDDTEIEVHRVSVNGVDLLYVSKKCPP